MTETEKLALLEKAKHFFKEHVAKNHIKNTQKLSKLKTFDINPFTCKYLANFLTGTENPIDIAKALVLPRALGSSISTTLGTNLQNHFCNKVLGGFGSPIAGIDIEFVDFTDGRKKYCQLKAGLNTINGDDVAPMKQKFRDLYNRAKTNNSTIRPDDIVLGIAYGKISEISNHYKKVAEDYDIYIGQDFWYRLTGDEEFYYSLIDAFGQVALDVDGTALLEKVISELAQDIDQNLNEDYWK